MRLTLGLVLALLAAPARAEAPALDRFVAEARALAGDDDAGPLTNGIHYFASNERDLHLVAEATRGLGGALVAVAADPAYVLAGWSRPEALVLIDLDPAIVRLHAIYAAFFAGAADAAGFRRLWTPEGAEEARALLSGRADASELLALYEEASPAVARRWAELERRMAEHATPWLLSDAAQYEAVAGLVRAGRVVALRGDFTRPGAVRAVGEGLRAAGLAVGLLYLSNIEQYFLYNADFRANVRALPLARATVLRTLPGRPAGFEYILQEGAHFERWAQSPKVRSVYRIRGFVKGEHLAARTLYTIDPSREPP